MLKINLTRTLLLSFQLIGACLVAAAPQMIDIVFPDVDDMSDDCLLSRAEQEARGEKSVKGTCKKLAECPAALKRWNNEDIRPQTCYFEKFDLVVCCEDEKPIKLEEIPKVIEPEVFRGHPPRENLKRRSEVECDQYYYFKISVVHGEPTKPKEFPYMVALGWHSNIGNSINYLCGGVLISKKFVMTAAHCTKMGGDWPAVVRVGGVNLTDSTVNDVSIKRIVVHPGYNPKTTANDIALIELSQEVDEKPACVWSRNDIEERNVTAIGYGHTKFAGVSSDHLLKASLFVVSNDVCSQFYTTADNKQPQSGIRGSHICAGDPEHLRDTCQGDSGGPIIMQVDRDQLYAYVVGITSFGRGCAGEPPSVYTRTSSYIDWIEDIVWPTAEANTTNTKLK